MAASSSPLFVPNVTIQAARGGAGASKDISINAHAIL